MVDMIEELVKFISNPEIQQFVREYMAARMETFKKPASSTHKYHPDIANGEYGLYHHTMLCVLACSRLIDLYKEMGALSDLDVDVIYAATILHDADKYEHLSGKTNPKFTTKEHGFVTYRHIEEEIENRKLPFIFVTIADVVRLHMSNWCHDDQEKASAVSSCADSLVHRIVMEADMIASSRELMDYCRKETTNASVN